MNVSTLPYTEPYFVIEDTKTGRANNLQKQPNLAARRTGEGIPFRVKEDGVIKTFVAPIYETKEGQFTFVTIKDGTWAECPHCLCLNLVKSEMSGCGNPKCPNAKDFKEKYHIVHSLLKKHKEREN